MAYLTEKNQYSSITGFYCEIGDTRYQNFLLKYNIEEFEKNKIEEKLKKFTGEKTILINFWETFETKNKGKGHGSKVLKDFMKNPCELFLCVVDIGIKTNFDKVAYLENKGFEIIGYTKYGPFMIKRNS